METLEQKLARLSEQRKETKENETKAQLEKELAPVRARIQELEDDKYRLETIQASLEIKTSPTTGSGMKEYQSETNANYQKVLQKLKQLFDGNKEALRDLGIETEEDLLKNEEFTDTPEVIEYLEAKEKVDGLQVDNSALKKRLVELGMPEASEGFSYEEAEKLVAEKLSELESEIWQEKIKTPEGREQAVENVAEQVKNKIPQGYIRPYKGLGQKIEYSLSNSYGDGEQIIFTGDEVKYDYTNSSLLPDGYKDLEDKFGTEIVSDGIKLAHETHFQTELEKLDAQKENFREVANLVEIASPEKAQEAEKEFDDFLKTTQDLAVKAKEKYADLDSKFRSGNYRFSEIVDDMCAIGEYSDSNERLQKVFNESSKFPPQYNWDELKEVIITNKKLAEEFFEAFLNPKSEEDLEKFMKWGNNDKESDQLTIGSFYGKKLKSRLGAYELRDKVKFPQAKLSAEGSEKLGEQKTFNQVEEYSRKGNEILDGRILKANEKLGEAIDLDLIRQQLEVELKSLDSSYGNIYNINQIDGGIQNFEERKAAARDALVKLSQFEVTLPEDHLILLEKEIKVPSIDKKRAEGVSEAEAKKKEIEQLQARINKHKNSEPRLFKSKWQQQLAELEAQKTTADTELQNLKQKNSQLYQDSRIPLPFEQNSPIANILRNSSRVEGPPSKIFEQVKEKLAEISDKQFPENIIRLNEQYKKKLEKLTEKTKI